MFSAAWRVLPRAAAGVAAAGLASPAHSFYDARKEIGAYKLGPTLGEGAFATVRQATSESGTYACKIINMKRMDATAVAREVSMMKKAGTHRHLVSLVDVVELPDARALVLDLAEGGEVFEHICKKGCYSEKDAAAIIRQVGEGLKHLHARGIAHRDLKPENLLLVSAQDNADVKICDLGCAVAPCSRLDQRVGTPGYAAPEMLDATSKYDERVDVFALGVILFVLLAGYHPFDPAGDASDAVVGKRIKKGDYCFHEDAWRGISEDARDVVRQLLQVDPARRGSVIALLETPWVAGAASSTPLPEATQANLKQFNAARRHWGAAIRAAALVGSAPVAAASVAAGAHLEGPLSEEAIEELREAFDALDVDRTGKVTLAGLRETMGALGHGDEAVAVFEGCDTHHYGYINFDEFVEAVGPIYDNSTAALQRAFAIFDQDGDGGITRDEFATIMDRLHLLPRGDDAAAAKAVDEMFTLADLDHNGSISFDEFRMMFHQRAAAAPPPRSTTPAAGPRFHSKHHTTKVLTAAFIK
mmetsp:Transcript_13697/g.42402  ORF Transcript_13697/g.42402 Transcript_13697/m.42402 type:complete len:530 (-) Transcript_13697:59-1648(-)